MLVPRAILAQAKRLANTDLLPEACTITRYSAGDGYTAPAIAATTDTNCRILLRQTTVQLDGGITQVYAGQITLPADPLQWTAAQEDDGGYEEPDTFLDIAQVNDRITHNGLEYRIAALAEPRIDGVQINYVAYLESGYTP
jgi:hypothetical protein